ncbi:hypothetical protein [Bordetella genomosp. 11]|uniref:Phage tail protein n=1 Tax=Bordetella genomosp. 11 TaxID=1416808 RepID=A0A261UJW8_9BORD|nr:hypothetical protein [Bordetella genomosp. 11]OZI61550.1 hypothetical protein CAL28_19910 [Bordetella genomosp. 11]
MAIPNFPAYARMIRDGFTEKRDFGVIRSDMDGLAKQRPRWSKPVVTRSVTVMVQGREDKAAFDAFVADDLDGGSGWFTFKDPVDGATKQGRFVAASLQWSVQGEVWLQQAQLESIG